MGETSYPEAKGAGVTDARYERLMAPVMGCGRIALDIDAVPYNTNLVVGDGSGRQVKIRPNDAAIVRGFRWETDSAGLTVPLEANTSGRLRIDMITLRLDRENEAFTVRVHVIKGAAGSSATVASPPTPVQQVGSTGVYDWPIALVKVASNNTSGQPLINAADVTRLDYHISVSTSASGAGRDLVIPPPGSFNTDIPGRKVHAGIGRNSYILVAEDGDLTKVEAGPGWDSDNIYCQRRNGFTYFQAILRLTASDKAASTPLSVAQLPPEFKPPNDLFCHGFYTPGHMFRASINASGVIHIITYGTTMQENATVSFQPFSWPSR